MHRGDNRSEKPEFEVVRARAHLITKSRSHLPYSNHSLSPVYQTLLDNSNAQVDCRIKLIVLGANGIGKTALIYRIFNNSTLYTTHIPTAGVHVLSMNRGFTDVEILPGSEKCPLKLNISLWDYEYHKLHLDRAIDRLTESTDYFKDVHAVLLCYAIDDRPSFTILPQLIQQLYTMTSEDRVAIVLVGLRTDADRPYLTDAQTKMQRYQGWRVISV